MIFSPNQAETQSVKKKPVQSAENALHLVGPLAPGQQVGGDLADPDVARTPVTGADRMIAVPEFRSPDRAVIIGRRQQVG